MDHEGPALEVLLQRLANTPEEFLAEPKRAGKGTVDVAAVAADLCRLLGDDPAVDAIAALTRRASRNALCVSLILCWVYCDPWFRSHGLEAKALLAVLGAGARELAEHTPSRAFVEDPERREELARFALARLSLRPLGESKAQAEDRLTSLSAAERARVLAASRQAEARARAVRKALARKAAEESADKWTRE